MIVAFDGLEYGESYRIINVYVSKHNIMYIMLCICVYVYICVCVCGLITLMRAISCSHASQIIIILKEKSCLTCSCCFEIF